MYVRTSQSGRWGLGDALVDCLSSAITQVEGYNPNFAANNNPGNLIYVGQAGAVPGAGGFAKFPTPAAGQAALNWQVQNYINRGYTPTQFFNTWAPAGTSNAAGGQQTSQMTANYISTVSGRCGLDPNVPLQSIQASYPGGSPSDSSLPSDSGATLDLSSLVSSSGTSYDIGGLVLSGPDLALWGAVGLAALLVLSKL